LKTRLDAYDNFFNLARRLHDGYRFNLFLNDYEIYRSNKHKKRGDKKLALQQAKDTPFDPREHLISMESRNVKKRSQLSKRFHDEFNDN